jgi:hypothetical protein
VYGTHVPTCVLCVLCTVAVVAFTLAACRRAHRCTYPIPEEIGAALMLNVGNWTGIACILGVGALIDDAPTYSTVLTPAAICIAAVMLVAGVFIALYNGHSQCVRARAGGRVCARAGMCVWVLVCVPACARALIGCACVSVCACVPVFCVL